MIRKTLWFIMNSKVYVKGLKPSLFQWTRALIRFLWYSRKDDLMFEPAQYKPSLYYPQASGFLKTGTRPNVMNILETEEKTSNVWPDIHKLIPYDSFDGQFFYRKRGK